MGLEIRPAKAGEMGDFYRSVNLSFAAPPQFSFKMTPEWTYCAFADGHLASTYAVYPLTMRFNGSSTPVAGITMVTTLPIYRRQGHLRKITESHFKVLHERGENSISALFASMAAIYQRYGYAVVSSRNSYTTEPRFLKFSQTPAITGELREAGENDMELLLDIYHRSIEHKTGYLHRNKTMEVAPGAPFTIFNLPPASPSPMARLVYWESGKPQGYLIYSVDQDMTPGRPMAQRLTIRDLIWITAPAYLAIWNHLSNMDLVRDLIWWRLPPDDPLPHLLLEPKTLNSVSADGLLARIIDVEKALPKRRYFKESKLTFEVVDDICPWNSGKWKLETSESAALVKRTNEGAQIKMPVSTLAMIAFGQISATEAGRMARLDVHDHNALSSWDEVMKTMYKPFCDDMF